MKLIQYLYEGVTSLGIQHKESVYRVSEILEREVPNFTDLISGDWASDLKKIEKYISKNPKAAVRLAEVELLAPIQKPLQDILAVGVNYFDHVKEASTALNETFQEKRRPVFFSKRAQQILGPGQTLQGAFDLDPELDYEAELAVIIGKTGKNIQPEDSLNYVFGYSCFNDFSSRTLQRAHQQWFKGKSLDGYTAMGPVIVTKDDFDLSARHSIQSFVNGEKRQDALISQMMTTVPEIISQLSQGMTLVPGDIIATGTPAGVAMGMDKPKYLQPGDTVKVHIDDIGDLITHIE